MKTPAQCIDRIKQELMKNDKIVQPEWAKFVKTGVNAERMPLQKDWWYIRSAAILRKIYLNNKPVGIQRLRTAFGGKRRRGHKPPHRKDAGGKIIRTMVQQLEEAGYIKQAEKPKRGRIITSKGQSLVDKCGK